MDKMLDTVRLSYDVVAPELGPLWRDARDCVGGLVRGAHMGHGMNCVCLSFVSAVHRLLARPFCDFLAGVAAPTRVSQPSAF